MQSKKQSSIESVTNIVVGLITSFLIQIFLYPIMGIPVTLNQNIALTTVFFVASFLRGYFLRRYFNKRHSK
jgi:high-affinity Fe2+/Pb2+ permease